MNWLHTLWFGYGWPSLQGNGPEALIQTIIYGAIALIFIPPCRRWFTRHYDGIKAHVEKLHLETRAHITAEHAKVHARLDAMAAPPKKAPVAKKAPPK